MDGNSLVWVFGMFKLLIIDDEASIRFSIQKVFQRDAVQVFTAENRRDGLALFGSESPDVVLLDICLGSESGLELFDEIRQIDAKCPVIFITGHGTVDMAIDATARGAFDYLIKPLDVDRLKQVVERGFTANRLTQVPRA